MKKRNRISHSKTTQMVEAPVFYPTPAQFSDPIAYIRSIKPQAEKFGICKIIPPAQGLYPGEPGFREYSLKTFNKAVYNNEFRFKTKLQKVHALKERNGKCEEFLNTLRKFLLDVGITPFKDVPIIDNIALDVYQLFRQVLARGGHEKVCSDNKWEDVAARVRVSSASIPELTKFYKRYLLDYELDLTNRKKAKRVKRDIHSLKCEICRKPDNEEQMIICDGKGCDRGYHITCLDPPLESIPKGEWFCDHCTEEDFGFHEGQVFSMTDYHRIADEFKQRYYRFMKLRQADLEAKKQRSEAKKLAKKSNPKSESNKRSSPNNKIISLQSHDDEATAVPITVNGTAATPSTSSSTVKLEAPSTPTIATNGSTQIKTEPIPEQIKCEYDPEGVFLTPQEIEQEFWRVVEGSEDYVQVHYGSDVDCFLHASGFPIEDIIVIDNDDHTEYCLASNSSYGSWNMNVLARAAGSPLCHVKYGVPGVTHSMLYIGMLFSTFCWHNEDNYLYSINYVHSGAPKTWYGLGGMDAVTFEKAMKSAVPDLFEEHPDLLHLLITMLPPEDLLRKSVPLVHTIQYAGEMIITFPQAYHAGFAHGFNVAESVNFATYDWLPYGRKSIERYRIHRRKAVLSHEEIIVKSAKSLNMTYMSKENVECLRQDLRQIIKEELALQKHLQEWGINRIDHVENEDDDALYQSSDEEEAEDKLRYENVVLTTPVKQKGTVSSANTAPGPSLPTPSSNREAQIARTTLNRPIFHHSQLTDPTQLSRCRHAIASLDSETGAASTSSAIASDAVSKEPTLSDSDDFDLNVNLNGSPFSSHSSTTPMSVTPASPSTSNSFHSPDKTINDNEDTSFTTRKMSEILRNYDLVFSSTEASGLNQASPAVVASKSGLMRQRTQYFGPERKHCYVCKYDCYISAVKCDCKPNRIACLFHAKHLCECDPAKKTILVWHDVQSLQQSLQHVEDALQRIESEGNTTKA